MLINYIPVFYFGIRRYNNSKDRFVFLKKHLEFISSLSNESNIEATFVINKTDKDSVEEIDKIVSNYTIKIPFEIFYRNNTGYSYGGWNDAIKKNIAKNYDYSFLIEDDYIPTSDKFYEPFLKEMDEEIAFVCTKTSTIQDNVSKHAAISNGLISNEKCRIVLNKNSDVFYINSSSNYTAAEISQVRFLLFLSRSGFDFKEISDDFSKPFLDSIEDGVIFYGGKKEAPIVPIVIDKDKLL